jgi:sugar phosphate isomerase/epimerase
MIGVAAEAVARQGMQLVVENDFECNTATSTEVARLLGAVPLLWLAWDPANAVMAGELDAFPRGWSLIPKDRIRLCRCKNVDHNADGALEWSQVDVGFIDWTKQFRALKDAGYTGGIQLETHWSGGGTPEECSRISLAAMKRALQAAGAL